MAGQAVVDLKKLAPSGVHCGILKGVHEADTAAEEDMVGIVIYLIDGHAEYMYVPFCMNLAQLGTQVATRSGVFRPEEFSFFEIIEDPFVHARLLPESCKVADLWSMWQRMRTGGCGVSRLQWQRRFLRKDEVLCAEDPAHAALAFRQAMIAHLRQPAPSGDDPELLFKIAAALVCAEFDQVATDLRKKDCLELVPRHAVEDLSRSQREEWRQRILQFSRKRQLRQHLGPHVPFLDRMSYIFQLMQQTRFFGAMVWRARQTASLHKQSLVSTTPAQTVSLHPREAEPDVWIIVQPDGVHLLAGNKRRSIKRWALCYRDRCEDLSSTPCSSAKAATRAGVGASNTAVLQKLRACRLLDCTACDNVLQFVVVACGNIARDLKYGVSLACPEASNVALAVQQSLADSAAAETR